MSLTQKTLSLLLRKLRRAFVLLLSLLVGQHLVAQRSSGLLVGRQPTLAPGQVHSLNPLQPALHRGPAEWSSVNVSILTSTRQLGHPRSDVTYSGSVACPPPARVQVGDGGTAGRGGWVRSEESLQCRVPSRKVP